MLKVFATQVVISRGYDNKPAISITRGNDSAALVRFRIGKKVYVKKIDFDRAFGAIVSTEKHEIVRDFAIKDGEE